VGPAISFSGRRFCVFNEKSIYFWRQGRSMIQELFRRVLVGADGTEHSQFAIDAAIAVATKFNAELHCVGVIPQPALKQKRRALD
jgi:phosphomannomutase